MAELVFDVGMHNGDDTAYYLYRGLDVVAIEANAVLCGLATERFSDEIDAGRLSIRNIGIADTAGELEFWVSDQTEWSSFDKDNATKGGALATPLSVATLPFSQLLAEYREPRYIKVDIECNDTLCIRDLAASDRRPPFVSFEGHPGATADIDVLAGAGYQGFKCVRQHDWAAITPANMRRQLAIRGAITRFQSVPRLGSYLYRRHYRAKPVSGWTFPPGSSGPFGADLPGGWLSRDEVVSVWNHRTDVGHKISAARRGEWFDIHAALSP